MSATISNLNPIYRKNTWEYLLTFTDDAGDALPITGWTIFFTVKESFSDADADAKISKDITSHYDAAGGISKISLTSSDTDVTPGNYIYDIQVLKDDGSIVTILIGEVKVKSRVTERIA